MSLKSTKSESGISILEILVVLVIGLILVTLAVSQFGSSKNQFERQNIAREFKVSLERCRFDSVRRRASDIANMSRVVIKSPTSYDVMTDSNQDGLIESFETRSVDFTNRTDVKIIVPTTDLPVTIRFDQRGHITTDGDGAPVTPLFTFCSGTCDSGVTVTAANSNIISISPTGTVTMLYGGDTIPPLDDPVVKSINNGEDVNLWVTVMPNSPATPTPSLTPGAPTPTATPTPTPTPTPAPVSTPTPTATPQPTPTPVPTPRSCALNERPDQTGCVCQAPRSVKSNKKCQ